MKYKYSLFIIVAFAVSYNTFAIENPFDTDLSDKILSENKKNIPEVLEEVKKTFKNITGGLTNGKQEDPLKKDSLSEEKVHMAYKLIEALPTLSSVEDLSNQIYKIGQCLLDLTKTDADNVLGKLNSTIYTMNEIQKYNLFIVFNKLFPEKVVAKAIEILMEKNYQSIKDFVDQYNNKYATQIANGTMVKMQYPDLSEQLALTQEKNSIDQNKRNQYISRIVHFYAQHKFAMIASGTALLIGIGTLLHKAYQKYYKSKVPVSNTVKQTTYYKSSCTE